MEKGLNMKHEPELINVRMQLGVNDDKSDKREILHLIILCSGDEDKDHNYIYQDDVQNFKDVACCYDLKILRGSREDLVADVYRSIADYLSVNTMLYTDAILQIATEVKDRVSDLKGKVESNLYFNGLGPSYLKHNKEVRDKISKVIDSYYGSINTNETLESIKWRMIQVLRDHNIHGIYPIITSHEHQVYFDFKRKDQPVKREL